MLVFATISAEAQKRTQDYKPKVGLVLSGGGAKGLAHIGALKVIDSLGVKVDYVAGTSMGAIIGGLYAAGYSGKQLDSLFQVINFDDLLSDELPRASKTFSERDNAEKYAVKLPFNNFSVKLPSAISKGHNTYNLFSDLLMPVGDVDDFSKLPIPFFCVATNVENGMQVILNKGNLVQSIMASGALPSLYQPVIINDAVLVDGGVVNNYPVDELRDLGMDVVIGVDVQDGLADRERLTSAPDVLFQINNFRTISDMRQKVRRTDIYIKPNIMDFSVISFDEGQQIIDAGTEAALTKVKVLKKLPKHKPNGVKLPLKYKYSDSIAINEIQIKGNKDYTRAYVLGKLKLKSHEKISYQDFNDGVNNLVATNNFDAFEYQLKHSKDTVGFDLLARVEESSIDTYLKFGAHYDDLYKTGILLNLTKKRMLFKNDEMSLDVILGDNVRYDFEYLIDKGFYWSIGVKSRYNQFDKKVSAGLVLEEESYKNSGLNKIDVKLRDFTNQFYVQTLFRRDFAFSIGAEHKFLELETENLTGLDNNDYSFRSTNYLGLVGALKMDQYDDFYFPSKGVYFDGQLNIYLYSSSEGSDFENYSIAKANMGYATRISNKLAFNYQASGGFKFGDKSDPALDFALGGFGSHLINNFVPFLGYDFVSLTGNSYVKSSLTFDYEIFKKQHILLEGNWANIDDDIFDSGEWFTLPDYTGYSLGYGVETFIGPIQLKYTYSPELGESIWFFNVGFWF
ncbi:patatin-like phospholipase family protein [Tamlana sp. 2_MG-2023]|uniref:patatin-like phospholipase family protein n=1 Tax=unclassified Tamlana TaxID=2614803 RepID=UPI0026E2F8A0|nr:MULTISPECIES: patatin-like phospholipase family protein [unclassified Tamlana]MDO6760517.1 patatin-like phospholipase family protein [Tamlana sp. 2_MG-2023]MDO6790773.1 patatin-like phospholipase family protein [Tamlana sp. 1_MG-2023]